MSSIPFLIYIDTSFIDHFALYVDVDLYVSFTFIVISDS